MLILLLLLLMMLIMLLAPLILVGKDSTSVLLLTEHLCLNFSNY